MEWQPIESAPKDGEVVLTYASEAKRDGDAFAVVVWHSFYKWQLTQTGNESAYKPPAHKPTHWMPLPPTPETKE